MLERLGDRVKKGLRDWTDRLANDEQKERMQALARPQNEYGVDPFGYNLDFSLSAVAPFLWLYRNYFRVETFGVEKVPAGRVLLVSNHSGQLPLDGAMIGVSLMLEASPPRAMRSMVEKWVPSLPYVSTFMARMGQIVGTPENCRRLLESDEAILVFPEGLRGINKLWPQRYQLQEFGLGFMRLALETRTPIVPVAVVGAEEQAPALMDLKPVAKLLGFPSFPITPTGVPFPLPTKYRIYFGDPMHFSGRPDDEDSELDKKVRTVKAAIQSMLHQGLKERRGVFW
ncbi:lysophospholipid acyltransferase family protein [Myxococcus sp. MISCRS1]|jgi:1-acyl-sn-glycerol-3-phosphate acyltransferase|uniref:lysophospholipid acyltransferase family protein n=1 Tax=Myxococcus TaxID=32 RepID=UPI0011447EC5|nr:MULTISPECIES: lysophospholipid acyltransferase family protein [Myxococcus]BDT32685.1 acyltransferase family protein [Myxococcus sp. MH1]MBZ4400555.1 acyltransferase family protein [Myxococcus sp. AS-1-15]MBZ4412871.1 acyltransferase family protein [Myxococcus sp. XM-1-1-1]MCK8501294.1 acyltransferase family protein [Myxococcus fulvus]MCY0997299.1 lysophospholipid acyltransferase family protein [Myxococcus sp. MISCRS1]